MKNKWASFALLLITMSLLLAACQCGDPIPQGRRGERGVQPNRTARREVLDSLSKTAAAVGTSVPKESCHTYSYVTIGTVTTTCEQHACITDSTVTLSGPSYSETVFKLKDNVAFLVVPTGFSSPRVIRFPYSVKDGGETLSIDGKVFTKEIPTRQMKTSTGPGTRSTGTTTLRFDPRDSDVIIVQRGQTLSSIARAAGVSLDEICQINTITLKKRINSGDKLRIRD